MALVTKAIKGTGDFLPSNSNRVRYVEEIAMQTAENFGYHEIRTPVFEHTELFQRGVGDTTDVVQKEMYTFDDKGGRSITLRPEGTAGVIRSFLEHGLFNEPLPFKASYLTSCYRYEKPQAGRLREFHQFGIECVGASEPSVDAEIISLAYSFFMALGVNNIKLEINSIGCPECRKKYHEALSSFFEERKEELCDTCLERLKKNPMRILDCKSPVCSEITKNAPVVLDYICDDCRDHFETVKKHLDAMNIEYTVNPGIVRGLDYYTRTVFEFISTEIGAQGAVCGGGRYDGLVEQLGGTHVPSLGFAIGIERLLLLMDAQNIEFPAYDPCVLFIAAMGDRASLEASKIAFDLRLSGISAQFDTTGRSLKAQMKYASKLGSLYSVVIGDDELDGNSVTVKNMDSGETVALPVDGFSEAFSDYYMSSFVDALNGMFNDSDITVE